MKIANENTGFTISTTGIEVRYTDDGELTIRLCAKKNDGNEVFLIEIQFQCVAEVACKTINFYENNYDGYQVITEKCSGSQNDSALSGFYKVIDSLKLKTSRDTYDPKNRLKLQHYLITGGDSYIEILASDYCIRTISGQNNDGQATII